MGEVSSREAKMKVVIIGGTGLIGRKLTAILEVHTT
jgi:hypothetical protein